MHPLQPLLWALHWYRRREQPQQYPPRWNWCPLGHGWSYEVRASTSLLFREYRLRERLWLKNRLVYIHRSICNTCLWAEMRERERERGRTSRIQSVDINAQVDWFCNPDPVSNFLDNSLRADSIYFPCLNNFKAAITIIIIVAGSR